MDLAQYDPKIKMNEVSITLQLRESVYEKIESLLESTSRLSLEKLKQEQTEIGFSDILERDRQWKCAGCC